MKEVMYRTETAYGSGERNIVQVIFWEIAECGNTDIPAYILSKHMNCLSEHTVKNLALILDEKKMSDKQLISIIETTVHELNKFYGLELKYCLWLTSKEAAYLLYDGDEDNIDEYEVSDIILSDLGFDGKLFAYEKFPEVVEHV